MKTLLAFFMTTALILFNAKNLHAQTNTFPSTGAAGIGTLTPNTSSLLEISSTTKGILIPRMTLAQRNAIATPATGLMIFQTNGTPGFYYYNGTAWVAISIKGANTALSNLAATTSINQNLLPNSTSILDLGSPSFKWRDTYTGSIKFSDGTQQTTASQWVANGSNIYFNGAVGIGVSSPAYKLDILGDINLVNGNVLRVGGTPMLALNTSSGNIAVGQRALLNNTTGYSNIALGTRALYSNTDRSNLVAIGDSALFNNGIGAQSVEATDNTAVGSKALYSNTTGYFNTANGYKSLYFNTTGAHNTAYGLDVLYSNTIGYGNTANGTYALYSNTTGYFNTANGYHSLYSNTTGYSNAAVGMDALYHNTTGHNLVAIGDSALFNQINYYDNTAIGSKALYSNITGDGNTAVGHNALHNSTSGSANTATGLNALYSTTNGVWNTANGDGSLYSNTVGGENSANGAFALNSNLNGSDNTASGFQALSSNVSGTYNTANGSDALLYNTGSYNTSNGGQAGSNVTTGSFNTFIGYNANCGSGGLLHNSTAIGDSATVTTSNTFVFGNGSVTGWGFGVLPGARAIKVGTNTTNGNGAYLTTAGVWQSIAPSPMKENFQKQDPQNIMKKIDQLEITKWKFKGTKDEYHYGPMTEDFHRLFAVGDDSSISDMDKTGVLFLGMQALSKENDSLKSQVNSLNDKLNAVLNKMAQMETSMSQCCSSFSSSINSSNNSSANPDIPKLEQNIPNPFDGSCYIGYYIPSGVHNAQLRITDVGGQILKSYSVATSGYGKQTIYGNELSSGMYQYSLLIDGKLIDTKKMERLR